MPITIISNDCPKCIIAKKEFANRNPEIYADWSEIADPERRRNLITSVAVAEEDINVRPLIFEDDVFIDWQPASI